MTLRSREAVGDAAKGNGGVLPLARAFLGRASRSAAVDAGIAIQHHLRHPAARLARAIRAFLLDPTQVLAVVLLGALVVRAIWLWLPQGSLIFDESYYVNAARAMLGWAIPVGSPYAGSPIGLDPNTEHPPLGKALIAGSMLLFGDNGIGWRIPSLIAGMVALVALYGIVRAAGESQWLGVLAVGLFAFDNLSMVHGRIATLDILFLAPILVGAWLCLREQWALAGVAFALGSLVKLTAAFGLLAVLLLEAIVLVRIWRSTRRVRLSDLRPTILFVSAFAAVAVAGLWLLDARFSAYSNPVDHFEHMLTFGTSLQAPNGPTGIASNPWQWLVNDGQINYLKVAVDTSANGKVISSHATVDFRGALNPAIAGTIPIALLFSLWLAIRSGSRLALWAVAWMLASYLPYYPLVLLGHRITYLYYFLPAVPAIAVAVALLLLRSGLPRTVLWGYLAAVGWGFAAYFPFRQLP